MRMRLAPNDVGCPNCTSKSVRNALLEHRHYISPLILSWGEETCVTVGPSGPARLRGNRLIGVCLEKRVVRQNEHIQRIAWQVFTRALHYCKIICCRRESWTDEPDEWSQWINRMISYILYPSRWRDAECGVRREMPCTFTYPSNVLTWVSTLYVRARKILLY